MLHLGLYQQCPKVARLLIIPHPYATPLSQASTQITPLRHSMGPMSHLGIPLVPTAKIFLFRCLQHESNQLTTLIFLKIYNAQFFQGITWQIYNYGYSTGHSCVHNKFAVHHSIRNKSHLLSLQRMKETNFSKTLMLTLCTSCAYIMGLHYVLTCTYTMRLLVLALCAYLCLHYVLIIFDCNE